MSTMVLIVKKDANKKEISSIRQKIAKMPKNGVKLKQFCGVIALKKDALEIQKEMRNEWD